MREFGPARKTSTDMEAAAPYVGLARTLLGQLKNRMASGGLQQLARTYHLPDGTTIRVQSRFGQDSMDIEPAPTSNPSILPTPEQIEPPEETVELPEIPKVEVKNPAYMWIGCRIRWDLMGGLIGDRPHPPVPPNALQLVVMEPGSNGLVTANNGNLLWCSQVSVDASTQSVDLAALQADFSGLFPEAPAGMHCFGLRDLSVPTRVMFTKSGLRLYDYWQNPNGEVPGAVMPYDPLHPKGEARVVTNDPTPDFAGITIYEQWAAGHKWDVVAVLDPDEELRTDPFDPRPEAARFRKIMKKSGVKFGPSAVIPGDYVVKLMYMASPVVGSNRSGDAPKFLNPSFFRYTDAADARQYLTEVYAPLKAEIEVRVNKRPGLKIQTFQVDVADYLDESGLRAVQPFGSDNPWASCNWLSGRNPHAANWWPGAILVNPGAGSISKKDNFPSRMCEPGPYDIDSLFRKRYPLDIYIDARAGASFSYPTYPATVPYSFGYWIAKVLDNQFCGFYYESAEVKDWTVDQIAAAAPATADAIWYFDPVNMTFTDVTAEALAGGGGGGVGWWNYLRDKSLTACHRPVWMDLFNTAGIYKTGESTPVDTGQACCEDVYFGIS